MGDGGYQHKVAMSIVVANVIKLSLMKVYLRYLTSLEMETRKYIFPLNLMIMQKEKSWNESRKRRLWRLKN